MSDAGEKSFLKKAFDKVTDPSFLLKTALVSLPIWIALGGVDLILWHFTPGGDALAHALKPYLLKVFEWTGVDAGMNALAGMLGGGTEVMAKALGGTEMDGVFIPDAFGM